jgi:hypothetical protein
LFGCFQPGRLLDIVTAPPKGLIEMGEERESSGLRELCGGNGRSADVLMASDRLRLPEQRPMIYLNFAGICLFSSLANRTVERAARA